MVSRALIRPRPSRRLLAVGEIALWRSWVAIVLILMHSGETVVGGVVGTMVGVHVVVVAVVSVVMMVTVVAMMVVSNQTIPSIALTPHRRAAAIAYRRVASLWHVVRMRSAAGGQLPGAHGG